MTSRADVVFLFDVDNTLLDNDRVTDDLRTHLVEEFGKKSADHYWVLFEELRAELGYTDYLGALQRYRQGLRSEEHTSELQSLMRLSYAVFCLKKKKSKNNTY